MRNACRFDAQFFHPKFTNIQERIEATGRSVYLSDALATNSRGRQPLYGEIGLPVINSKHVRTNRVILDSENRIGLEQGSPVVIQTGDILLNGTGVGTIGRAAPYHFSENALPDNHVTVLRTKTMNPIYLSVFLNSLLGQLQIERHTRGSSGQVEIYPADISKIIVWDAPVETQELIRDVVVSAFEKEREANVLLANAKKSVEIAIGDGEVAALKFLKTSEQ